MSPNEIIRRDTVQATAQQARHPFDERVHVSLHRLMRLQHAAAGFSFLPRQPVASLLSGRQASRLRGRGLNFEEIRAYQAGDDIRMIDWKVTARTREAHSRVFTEERDRPGLLLVDQRVNMFFGTRVYMKSVTAAEVAALSAWRLLKATDRVGALVFNDTQVTHIRPHRSQAAVMRILEAIVAMNGALQANLDTPPNSAMLNRVLESAVQLAGHDYLVMVISDFDGADDDTRRCLMQLAQHNDVLGVLVHDPSATHLPPSCCRSRARAHASPTRCRAPPGPGSITNGCCFRSVPVPSPFRPLSWTWGRRTWRPRRSRLCRTKKPRR
jgi:uncharacterized protein (DUF58 family)